VTVEPLLEVFQQHLMFHLGLLGGFIQTSRPIRGLDAPILIPECTDGTRRSLINARRADLDFMDDTVCSTQFDAAHLGAGHEANIHSYPLLVRPAFGYVANSTSSICQRFATRVMIFKKVCRCQKSHLQSVVLLDKKCSNESLRQTQTVLERRIAELHTLKSEGFPIRFVSRWHVEVGPLDIWIAAGRWHNTATRKRGRINKRTIRELIARVFAPMIERGSQLCSEQEHRAKQERRKHQEFLKQHREYMNRLTQWRAGRTHQLSESSNGLSSSAQ
jgi:hypothetical protein